MDKKQQDGARDYVHRTECTNIPFTVAKTSFKICQRDRGDYYPKAYMHWRKLLVLFEPKKYADFFQENNLEKDKLKNQSPEPKNKPFSIFVFVNCSLLKVRSFRCSSFFFLKKWMWTF